MGLNHRNLIVGVVLALALVTAETSVVAETDRASPAMGAFRGAKPTEYPAWFKESFLEFGDDVKEAAQARKRVIVMFHQDGCPYCSALVERNLSQKDIELKMRKHFDVVALNMWGDREVVAVDGQMYTEKSFAAALRVQFTPTLLFLDERGAMVLRLNGYLPPQRFKLALDYVAGRHEQTTTYREYVKTHAPPATGGALHAESFFAAPPHDLSIGRRPADAPVAVFFEQLQCPNCDTLHAHVLRDPDTRTLIGKFQSVQLDMWSDTPIVTPAGQRTTAREWAQAMDVKYAPTIVLFNPDGEEVIRSEAFFKAFHTQSLFDYVASAAYRNEPSFQRYIAARADHIREQGKTVDIWR